jgi:hypothetical protein
LKSLAITVLAAALPERHGHLLDGSTIPNFAMQTPIKGQRDDLPARI